MWLAGDAIFLAAILALVAGWMRAEARDTGRTDRRAAVELADIRVRERPAGRTARPRARGRSAGEWRLEVGPVLRRIDVPAADDADDRARRRAQPELRARGTRWRPGPGRRSAPRPGATPSAASRTAAAISASVTVTMPSRWARRCANVRAPSACVRVPSAMVRDTSSADQRTISPRASESRASAASSGSTPITRAPGTSALMAAATPLARPPPPTGTTTAATSRQVLGDLEADRALPGDDPVVVVRRDDGEAAFRGDRLGPFAPLLRRRPDRDDLGAVRGHALALDRRARRRA